MTDETIDVPTSAEDAESLDREATAAAELAVELERRYINGDEQVTPEQIAEQEKLGRWAKLKAERARRGAEKAKAAARLDAANALRVEVEAYAKGVGKRLAADLEAITAAEGKLLADADEHDTNVLEFRRRAEALGVAVSDGRPLPPAKDGRLALGRSASVVLHAGRRSLELVHGKALLDNFRTHAHREDVVAATGRIDAESAEPEGDLYFYRGSGGGVIVMDRPLPDEQIKRDGIKVLTRAEAWGE